MSADDPKVERYDPDLWTDEFAFLKQPGEARHPKRSLLRLPHERRSVSEVAGVDAEDAAAPAGDLGQVRSLVRPREPEAYRRDVPKAEVHVLDAGHFALDTKADEIAELVDRFMQEGK